MRCSSCSREVKPVVAFDVDGTLGDYHGQLIEFAELYLSRPSSLVEQPYDGSMNFGDWMIEAFDLNGRKEYRDIKLAFRQGGSKRWMPAYRDMILAVRFVKEGLGCEVWLTTTRPYLRLDSVDPDTREWLRRNDVKFDHLMYDDHKYHVLTTYVDPKRIIAIVDDLPEQIWEASNVFTSLGLDSPAILYRTDYNESQTAPEMVWTGAQVQKLIKERLVEWREQDDELEHSASR